MVKYLITSGNSRVGRATVKALKALGETDVVAGARNPAKSEQELKDAGATTVVALDLDKQETVEKALDGVERVLIVHDGKVDFATTLRWAKTVIDAATRPGSKVQVIGKIGAIFADVNAPVPVIRLHGEILDLLNKTGLQVFQIGPSFFFENWLDNSVYEIRDGVLRGAAGDAEFANVAVDDLGAAAATLLKNPGKFTGRHLGLASDVVSEPAVLQAISAAIGKPLKYEVISFEEYEDMMKKRNYYSIELAVLREKLKSNGALSRQVRNPDLLQEILGRPPINAAAWAQANKEKLSELVK